MGKSKLKIPKTRECCGKTFEAKTVITRFFSKLCAYKSDNDKKKTERQEAKKQGLIAQIPTNRPYISVGEAVLLFGISRDTIYSLIRIGKIPAKRNSEEMERLRKAAETVKNK